MSKKIILTKDQANQRKEVRTIFLESGFEKIQQISDKNFTFKSPSGKEREGDFDDVFIYENVVVLVEYTCNANPGHHLQRKKLLFDLVHENQKPFIDFLDGEFISFKNTRGAYEPEQYKIIILYCSKKEVEDSSKALVQYVKYLDYPIVQYFLGISRKIKKSTRFELFKFFGLDYKDVGTNRVDPAEASTKNYKGSVLPEAHSGFGSGYKVVSFYLDPETLIERSYVLRKDGWNDSDALYQRMLIKNKIDKMRNYLTEQKRVFINNIIVTLPNATVFLDEKTREIIDPGKLVSTRHAIIQLPSEYNIVGIIDGQHRVYAYHEGHEKKDKHEKKIKSLRKNQNLLVTGVIYPTELNDEARMRFEAKLFLEINANQTGAKSDLKQAIEVILYPYSTLSISRKIIHVLNKAGPLQGKLEEHFYDKGKMKTSSVVSYGLMPIVKLSGDDSFFAFWKNSNKDDLKNKNNKILLDEYVEFCSKELDYMLAGFKFNIPEALWSVDRSISLYLTPTSINGLINCLRLLIKNGKTGDLNYYQGKLKGIEKFPFQDYKSSHWKQLGEDIYNKYF